jgi:hypothetical protein
MLTSNRTIRWIENLAEQELLIKSGEKASIDIGTTKEEVLAVETASFMRELFYQFEYLIQLFNSRVSQLPLQIKLVRGGEGPDGFCVSRNEMRLSVARPQPGIVKFQCDKILGPDSPGSARTSIMFSGSIEGEFGTFHDVEWTFLGSRVQAEQIARHYLTEFIQVSRGGQS